MNIYERLSAITTELSAVAKNLMVGEGKNRYKAVGEADVLAAVKPLEAKYGVYSYPARRRIVDSDAITVRKTYNGSETETTKLYMRLETVYRFVNAAQPDEYVEVTTYGDGVDQNDKAPGKAMTYADKYALLKAYKIITGDDPDQNPSEDGKITREKHPTAPESPAYHCARCGAYIGPYKDANGKVVSIIKHVEGSKAKFGEILCLDCIQSRQDEG